MSKYEVRANNTDWEWKPSKPVPELAALLKWHGEGYTYTITAPDGEVTEWRTRPKDTDLINHIHDVININNHRPPKTIANKVYDLLEQRDLV